MKDVVRWLGAALLLVTLPAMARIAVVGGTVHTVTGEAPTDNATVLVDGGQVRAVGVGIAIPDGYQRVDAAGRVITPGLIEPRSQLGLVEISGEPSTVDTNVADYRLGPAFDVQYAINPASTLLPVNRIEGVTRAVVAPSAGNDPLAGWGAAIRLHGADVTTHARLALFGGLGMDTASYVGGSRSAVVQRLRMALDEARRFRPDRYRSEHADYTRQDMAALQGFLRSGRPLVLTVHRANEIRQAVALARDFDVPLVIHGGSEAWQVADLLAEADVPVIVDTLANLPISYERLGARIDNPVRLWQSGVRVLFTADDSHNVRLLRQVAGNAVAEGMPWDAVLAAVTRAPAEVFGLGRGVGTITVGAPADLVIWNGDPFELTTWPERVMIDGEWVPMTSRQTRLLERYRELDAAEPFGYR